MRKIIFVLTLALCAGSIFAGNGIVISQKYTEGSAKGTSVTVTWFVTESQCKMKMEYRDDKVNTVNWFIPDTKSNSLLTYAEGAVPAGAQKSFFSIPVQDIKAGKNGNAAAVSVKRTGETKSMGGMLTCEKVMVRSTRGLTEMWVALDFPADFFKFYPFFHNSFELMGLSEEKMKGFPVSSVTKDDAGNFINGYEFISAAWADLSESDFRIPSEYKSIGEINKGKN